MSLIEQLLDRVSGKAPKGAKRSPKWRKVRNSYIKKHPKCAGCGSTKKLRCHHKLPFFLAPDLELDPKNLIVLCENKKYGINCHQNLGHRGTWKKFNPNVVEDVYLCYRRIHGKSFS